MEKIIVQLKERSYPIIIGSGVFSSFFSITALKADDVVVLITDNHVAPIYLEILLGSLKSFVMLVDYIILPSGECYKSLDMLEYIITKLLERGYNRNVVLFAIGGGVIGDLVGFTAAVYQRGVRFIQVPTTLLAQVDASVGGKTGVNHILGKNMIGAFYQPSLVIIDLDCLYTLPSREFSSGLAEVIKYGIAFDCVFFEWLECHLDDILNLNSISLSYCIRRCCELKSDVVKNDEYDKGNGVRALLNLGHTYAHAIESYFKYSGKWLHGEAVSMGLVMSANLSYVLGYFSNVDVKRVRALLLRAGLPIIPPEQMMVEDYLSYMMRDKKNILGQLCLIVPVTIGSSKICIDVKREFVELAIKNL